MKLINITNHPEESWSERQRQEALKIYEEIVDWPFPKVPTLWSEKEVVQYAVMEAKKIIAIYENTDIDLHIMGEMTYSFVLIQYFLARGFRCVASCRERVDSTSVPFKFARFRAYRLLTSE